MQVLEGRAAVVTGAASGMGRGLAERFAREGMKVVLADVEESALNRVVVFGDAFSSRGAAFSSCSSSRGQ